MTRHPLFRVKEGGEWWGGGKESGGFQNADQQVHRAAVLTEVLDDSREAQDTACVGVLHQVHGAGQDLSVCGTGWGDWQWKNNSGT